VRRRRPSLDPSTSSPRFHFTEPPAPQDVQRVAATVAARVNRMLRRKGLLREHSHRFGVRWQIVPAALDEMMHDPDEARSKRVTDAMLKMGKLDIAALEKAFQG